MRSLSSTLTAEQQKMSVVPVVSFVFTHGEDSYTYDTDRFLRVEHNERHSSHKAELILQNSDGVLTDLDLKSFAVSPNWGLRTSAGEETSETAPLWVKDKQNYSLPGRMICRLSCIGIPDRLAEDKANDNQTVPAGSTKTVKDLFTEIADGQAVTDTDIEDQTSYDSYADLYTGGAGDGLTVGQKLITSPGRTITKLAFMCKKTGSPSGNLTFTIQRVSDEATLGSATFAVSGVGAYEAWCEVTFASPVAVSVPVYLFCKHLAGSDSSNYVQVAYNSTDAKSGENLVYIPGAGNVNEDCAYKYTYQVTGMAVFDHCQAWEVVYDSEDALIDVYIPKDGLSIREGESRLSVLDRLLQFTGCERMFKADGKIHVLVPTTSGEVYDYEYALTSGHTFFNKAVNDGLVIPNRVVVSTYDDDETPYSGSATSATSYALMPISASPIRAKLSSDAQATAIAEAFISRLEVASQQGNGTVPMNVGAELWDYEKITDERVGDSKVGNVGYLRRLYQPQTKTYEMSFGFGGIAVKGVPGTSLAELTSHLSEYEIAYAPDAIVKWGLLLPTLRKIAIAIDKLQGDVGQIGIKVGYFDNTE